MDRLLGILIFASFILVTLQESSPEVTGFEILVGGILLANFFAGLIHFLLSRKTIPKPLIYLFAFAAWASINIAIASANGVEWAWWFRRFFPILTLAMTTLTSMVAFRSVKQIRDAYITLITIGLLVVVQALVQIRSINIASIANLQHLRQYGGGYYSAFTLCLVFPFLFYHRSFRPAVRLLIIGCVGISFLGLILSFTRTYWISTFIALLFMVYLLSKAQHRPLVHYFTQIAFIGGLIAVILRLVTPANVQAFIVSRILSIPLATSRLSFQDRVTEIEGLWNSAIENPITVLGGNGLGAKFSFYSVNPWSWGGTGWIENDYSHNYYAYLFWSTGLVGLSLFLLFWGSLLRQATRLLFRSSNASATFPYYLIGICTATVNLLVASLTGPPLMSFKWAVYFGVLVGLALNLIRLLQGAIRSLNQKHVARRVTS